MLDFLNPKISGFGIDLSDLSIKIVKLRKSGSDFSVTAYGRQDIPEGLIEQGEIKKEDELIEVIKQAVQNAKGHPLGTRYCVASLPETLSFVQVVRLPAMKEEEVPEAIKWELEAHIPLNKDEIYYDWQIINKEGNKDHLDVLLGVLPKRTVDPYLDVLKKAGLKPMAFEIEPVAITRALIQGHVSPEPVMIVDIGSKRTGLLIFYGQAVYFTTSLPVSNFSLVDALAQKMNVDKTKAKELKCQFGLDPVNPQVSEALKEPLREMALKIKEYADFYAEHIMPAQCDAKPISKVILCGGGAIMNGLPEFLAMQLGLPVELGKTWINLMEKGEKASGLPSGEALSFTTALGLALRGYDQA